MFRKHGVSPTCFELEITETTLMADSKRTLHLLDELYAMGLHLSIDDFGTGYSSLSALQQFPIGTLKIDQSFVRDVDDDESDATIVRTIIEMGRSLKMNVIAEGVESLGHLDFLRRHHCGFGQGKLFGEPVHARRAAALLARQASGTPPFAHLLSLGRDPSAVVLPDLGAPPATAAPFELVDDRAPTLPPNRSSSMRPGSVRPPPPRRTWRRIALLTLLVLWAGTAVWQTHKPLPGHARAGRVASSRRPPTFHFIADITAADAFGAPVVRQHIFDQVFELVRGARDFLVLDFFLFNAQRGGRRTATDARAVDRAARRAARTQAALPDLHVLVITDPINDVYGGLPSPIWPRCAHAGIDVVRRRPRRAARFEPHLLGLLAARR